MALGDIATNLIVNQRPFEQGLASAETRFRKFGTTVQQTSNSVAGLGGKRATFALLELSRGAEDAASQFGTMGLAGALRASGNNIATFATIINPMAGVVAGLGVALGSILIPKLLETKTAADLAKEAAEGLDKTLEEIRGRQEGKQNLADLSAGKEGSLEDQQKKVEGLRKEHEALVESLQRLSHQQTLIEKTRDPLLFGSGDDDRLAAIKGQIKEAEKRLGESKRTLQLEEFALAQGDAVRNPRAGAYMGRDFDLATRTQYDLKIARERGERENAERAEQGRLRGIDDESMQRSILTGFNSRLGQLRQRREGLTQSRRSFNLPELATRGNSADKQIEMVRNQREALAESHRKALLEKTDKQIELLEKLIEEVKDAGPALKPARVG